MLEENDGYVDIIILDKLLITNFKDPVEPIISSTYININQNYINGDFL